MPASEIERLFSEVQQLWQEAVQGDKRAENALFDHLRERFTVLAGLTICREDAKDVAQEACLAVLKGYKALGNPYEYNAWAQRILKNKIADYFQRRSLEKKAFAAGEPDDMIGLCENSAEYYDTMLTLKKCMQQLIAAYPPYARALRLKQEGFGTEEICERMGVTRNNLYVILNRGRKFLRDCIFGQENK